MKQALEIPIFYENFDDGEASPECEFIPRSLPKPTDLGDNEKKVSLMIDEKCMRKIYSPAVPIFYINFTNFTTNSLNFTKISSEIRHCLPNVIFLSTTVSGFLRLIQVTKT